MSNVKEYTKEYLEKHIKPLLIVGASIKIGKHYAEEVGGFKAGEVITLIEGHFDFDNGLYTVGQTAPSVWNEDAKEFDSIYHLFGNDLENFFDCEVIKPPPMSNKTQLPVGFQKELDDLIMEQTLKLPNDNEYQIGYERGIENGIEIGATAYATKLHEVQQENEKLKAEAERTQEVINAAEKVAKIFAHDDGNCAICELAKAIQQWKEGKEVGDVVITELKNM